MTTSSTSRPTSSELAARFKMAGWLGREFAYPQLILELTEREPVTTPAISLVLCLSRPTPKNMASMVMLLEKDPGMVQFILVCTRSESPLQKILAEKANVIIKLAEDCNAYTARNIASLYAKAKFLAFVSDQLRLSPGLPEAFVRTLSEPGVQAARGRITGVPSAEGSIFRYCDRTELPHVWAMDLDEIMAIKRDLFYSLGGFDEKLLPGYGALDLSARILARYPEHEAQRYCPQALGESDNPDLLTEDNTHQYAWQQLNDKYARDLLGYAVFWGDYLNEMHGGEQDA